MKGRFLAEFEIYVMLAIVRLGGDAYGVPIRREILERTARPVSMGALYATLGRLSDKEFLDYEISDPLPIPGGKSRKYWRLTPRGVRALNHSTSMLRRMLDGLELPLEGEST